MDSVFAAFDRPGFPFDLHDWDCLFDGAALWDVNDSAAMYDHWIDLTSLDLVGPGSLRAFVGGSVVWDSLGIATSSIGVGIPEWNAAPREVIMIYDRMGRETRFKANTPLIYMYSDGTRERVFRWEE